MKKCFALEDVEEAKWNSAYQDTYFCDKLSLEVRGGARLTAHQGEGDIWGGGGGGSYFNSYDIQPLGKKSG